jgi:hypothetical protein
MSRAYVAGPMRGIPESNYPAFFAAEELFRSAGWEVVNPARMDGDDKDTKHPAEFYRRRALPTLIGCDAIALLPGWQDSPGANDELLVARMCGLDVLDAETMGPLAPESILAEAERLVNGPRQAAYDHPYRDFSRTGRKWGATLDEWRRSGESAVPPHLVALCMVDLKTVREAHKPKRDHRVDGAGYLAAEDLVLQVEGYD